MCMYDLSFLLWVLFIWYIGVELSFHSCCKMPRGDRWRGDVRAGASNMLSSTGDYPMLSLPHSCTATTHFACHLLPLRLVYGNKLRQLGLRIKLFSQGDGAVNSVGGLQPDTVGGPGSSTTSAITIAGPIKSFWKIFSDSGYVLNWNGEVRVHCGAFLLNSTRNHCTALIL